MKCSRGIGICNKYVFEVVKLIFSFFAISNNFVYAQIIIKPTSSINTSGEVNEIEIVGSRAFIATSNSKIDIINLPKGKFVKTGKLQKSISIPQIHDYTGEKIGAKIYSLDISPAQKKLLDPEIVFVSQLENGMRQLQVFQNGKISKIIDDAFLGDLIGKINFIDDKRILIGFLSNSLAIYNFELKKTTHQQKINTSTFSDFALAENAQTAVFANESGNNYLINTINGQTISILSGANKDNVYKIAISPNLVATAGQDRIGGIYEISSGKYKKFFADFLIYACAISPNEKYVAYAFTEDNKIAVFDINTQTQVYTLIGHRGTLNSIKFINNKQLISGGDDKIINIWNLE